MCARARSQHDAESQEVGRSEQDDQRTSDSSATPGLEKSEHQPEQDQRKQSEDEAVEESEEARPW